MNRRELFHRSLIAGVTSSCFGVRLLGDELNAAPRTVFPTIDYKLDRQTPARRFDGNESFCHPRAGIVPRIGKNGTPRVVMTMNTIDLNGSDVYKAMYCLSTDNLGKTWTEPVVTPELSYRTEKIDGVERPVAASDFWPTWHKKSQVLLGTGHTVAYTQEWKVVDNRPRDTCFATYDVSKGAWNAWQKLPMPNEPKFAWCGAGSTQRYDLTDGTILLPIYYSELRPKLNRRFSVMRCSFDGTTLKYLDHGEEVIIDDGTRGFSEPSIAFFDNTYYLTVRHPNRGYVSRSKDGLRYEPVRPWTFDDGVELGSYETQQHWVTHSDGLFLVYTRRGANNDHVFRHRAPLFMAQVDPERLVVLRQTERELMPNRGARYGNFGVTAVSPGETWVTDAEWMQPKGCEKYGSDGSVFVAKIHWSKPNANF